MSLKDKFLITSNKNIIFVGHFRVFLGFFICDEDFFTTNEHILLIFYVWKISPNYEVGNLGRDPDHTLDPKKNRILARTSSRIFQNQ